MSNVIPFRRKGLNLMRMLTNGRLIPDVQKPGNKLLSKKRREDMIRKLWPSSIE